MRTFQDGLPRVLVIVSLVAVGYLYAHDPDMHHWPLSYFHAEGTARTARLAHLVYQIDWSADGRKLLTHSHGPAGRRLALHDVKRHDSVDHGGYLPIDTMGDSISSAALTRDARHVLAASFEGRLWWIDLESSESQLLVKLPRPASFTATAVSDDGRHAAAAADTGSIYIRRPNELATFFVTLARPGCIGDLRFSRDARYLIGARTDGSIAVWNVLTGTLLQDIVGHEKPVSAAEVLPDGKRIISVGLDDTARIWDIASGREQWRAEFGQWGITSLAVSKDGATAAWGGLNGRIIVWDLVRSRKKFEIVIIGTVIFDLEFSPAGTSLAVAGKEGTVRMYNMQTAAEECGLEVDLPPMSPRG